MNSNRVSRRQALKILGGAAGAGLAGAAALASTTKEASAAHGFVGPFPFVIGETFAQTTSTTYQPVHLNSGFLTSFIPNHTITVALNVQLTKSATGDQAAFYKIRLAKWDPAGAFVIISPDPFIEISSNINGWEQYTSPFVALPAGVEQIEGLLRTNGGTAKCRGAYLLVRYVA